MTYISSQHYLNPDIVAEKIEQLRNQDSVTIPFIYAGEIDGVEYAIQTDGHHALAAARELGIKVVFAVSDDPEGLTGEQLLTARWIDGDYYDVEASNPLADQLSLVW